MSFIPNNTLNNFFQTPMSINDFEVKEVKGHGKFGSVSKVIYKKTGMIFALKIINKIEETEIDFLREKQILYDLTKKNYKHVVKLYAHFEDYNNRYLVMEIVDGTNLRDLRGNHPNGYVDQKLVINILIQLLETLVYLHDDCHVFHRDIKPDNIILEKNGNIKLLDFGLSAYLSNPNPKLVSNRSVKGEIHFVPEEIIFATQSVNYDYKIDVFSLGFTIYSLMNPSLVGKNYNLPQKTTRNNDHFKREDNKKENKFYDIWLQLFVKYLYTKDKDKRPTAAKALNLLKGLLSKHNPIDYIKEDEKGNIIINLNNNFNKQKSSEMNHSNFISRKNNINNQIYNKAKINNMAKSQPLEPIENVNKINNPIDVIGFERFDNEVNNEPEEFITPDMGKKNKLKSSMKCILYILYKLDNMNYLNTDKMQSILNKCKSNNNQYDFLSLFQILNTIQKFENGQINLASYDQAINNFITYIFKKNSSGISGTSPMILFYMISHIFKDEIYENFKYNYENNIFDSVIQNNFNIFNSLVPMNITAISDLIRGKINTFKDRFRGPFVDKCYFLIILLSKCAQCQRLCGLKKIEVGQFLPLTVPNQDNNISDLVFNFFTATPGIGEQECENCFNPGKARLRQKYLLNLPQYLFLELEDKNKVSFNEIISIPLFNGKIYYYQFYSCIYKRRINDILTFSAVYKYENSYYQYYNDINEPLPANTIHLENPSLAIYKLISS